MKKRLLSTLLCAATLASTIPFATPLASAATKKVSDSYKTDLYEPVTSIAQAPIVMQTATSAHADITALEKRPSALIFEVRMNGNTLYAYEGNTAIAPFGDVYYTNQPKTNVGARIALGDQDAAAALATYVAEAGADNLWVISSDVEVLNTVTTAAPLVRGVIDFTQESVYAPADVAWSINTQDYTELSKQTYTLRHFTTGIDDLTREQIYDIFYSKGSGYTTALLPEDDTSAELISMLSAMGIFTIVETDATDKAGFYDVILTGANGILSSNYATNIAALEDTALFPADTPVLVRPATLAAHRGDPMYRKGWRENSLPALISAAESGATLVEFDVYMTTDKRLVLLHDEYTGTKYNYRSDCPLDEQTQAANAAKKISERAWAGDLEYVCWTSDNGTTGPINQLYELFEAFDTEYPDVYLYLEMKVGTCYEAYNRVIELTNQYGMRQRTTLISFSKITTEYGHAMGFAAKQLNTYGAAAGANDIKTIVTNLIGQRSNIFEQSLSVYTADTTNLQARLRHYGFFSVVGGIGSSIDGFATVFTDGVNRMTADVPHRFDKDVRRLIANYDAATGKVSASYEQYRHRSIGVFDSTSQTSNVYPYWIHEGYATTATTSTIADADFEIVAIAGNPTIDNTAKTATGKSGDVIAIRYKKKAITGSSSNPKYYYTYSPAIRLGAAVNKKTLQSTISVAQTFSAKKDNYTALSWKLLSEALTEATAISADTTATQATVDVAQASLQRRINELTYAEGATKDVVAYVDAVNPSDNPTIGDADSPYATISAAITALDALTSNVNRIVKVKGAYTCAAGVEAFGSGRWGGFANHTNLITIESANPADETALLDLSGVCTAGGPLKFDNVHYAFADTAKEFRADGYAVEFGKNAISHYKSGVSHGRVYTGSYAPGANSTFHSDDARHSLIINGQSFSNLVLGDASARNSKAYNIPGVDFVMNGGNVTNLLIGNYDSGYKGYNHFTDTVNLTINGGTVARYQLPKTGAILDNGKAVQMVLNNGTAPNWYYDGAAQSAAPTITDKAGNNALYVLQVGSHAYGATALAVTDTVGVYTTLYDGKGTATAVATAENGTVYTSKNGTLTIQTPGIYTVTWEVELAGDVFAYVDAANPSDSPAIDDASRPYATISAAITALDALTGNINRIVKVNGAYTCVSGVEAFAGGNWAGFAAHKNLITIESTNPADTTALLNLSNVCTAGGPIKFDNVHYLFSDNTREFRADGHAVEFGNNAISHYTNGTHGRVYTGAYAPGAYNTFHSDEARHSLTINGQSFTYVGLGDASPRNSKAYNIPGVDFVMNGGNITDLLIGNYDAGYKGYNHFTDNVNLTINGGTITRYQLPKTGAILDSGKALQIIVNNGGSLNWYYDGAVQSSAPTVTDKAGNNALYVLQAEANALGGALAVTDTVGVYAVSGAATAIATAEDGTVYTSKNGTLTVPAGIYTVSWKAPALVHGAQARDGANNHLRFIATAAVSGVTFRNDGSANYSNATITLNGQILSVLDVGMLVSLSRSSADDLSFATDGSTLSGVKKVAAQRLQSNAFAIEKGYRSEDEDFILFTAVVLNIPEAYVESAITTRAYVAYTDADGNTAYLYSDCVSRSYRMVAPIE